ncbi:MAG: lipoprotein [Burkholderiaceae bacterium]|nr:lipoprotein [Burkholderiaceae bacterium]
MLLPTLAMGLLGGCGQRGALYLPTGAAAAERASLPQTLWPLPRLGAASQSAPQQQPQPQTPLPQPALPETIPIQ